MQNVNLCKTWWSYTKQKTFFRRCIITPYYITNLLKDLLLTYTMEKHSEEDYINFALNQNADFEIVNIHLSSDEGGGSFKEKQFHPEFKRYFGNKNIKVASDYWWFNIKNNTLSEYRCNMLGFIILNKPECCYKIATDYIDEKLKEM